MCDCSYYPIQLRNDKYQLKNRLLETHTHTYILHLSLFTSFYGTSLLGTSISPPLGVFVCVCIIVYKLKIHCIYLTTSEYVLQAKFIELQGEIDLLL